MDTCSKNEKKKLTYIYCSPSLNYDEFQNSKHGVDISIFDKFHYDIIYGKIKLWQDSFSLIHVCEA